MEPVDNESDSDMEVTPYRWPKEAIVISDDENDDNQEPNDHETTNGSDDAENDRNETNAATATIKKV